MFKHRKTVNIVGSVDRFIGVGKLGYPSLSILDVEKPTDIELMQLEWIKLIYAFLENVEEKEVVIYEITTYIEPTNYAMLIEKITSICELRDMKVFITSSDHEFHRAVAYAGVDAMFYSYNISENSPSCLHLSGDKFVELIKSINFEIK